MKIGYDQDERATTLRESEPDYADAGGVFAGPILTEKDTRVDYSVRHTDQ